MFLKPSGFFPEVVPKFAERSLSLLRPRAGILRLALARPLVTLLQFNGRRSEAKTGGRRLPLNAVLSVYSSRVFRAAWLISGGQTLLVLLLLLLLDGGEDATSV